MLRDTASRSPPRPAEPGPASPSVRDGVRVRNYDHRGGHSVRVSITDARTDRTRSERCYLASGQSRTLLGPVEPGRYRLRVEVDGLERTDRTYRLEGTADAVVDVELGTGVVSVTTGERERIEA